MDFNYYTQETIYTQDKDETIYKFIIAFNAVAILMNLLLTYARVDDDYKKKYDELQQKYDELDALHTKDILDYNELVDSHNLLHKQLQDVEAKNVKDIEDYNELAESYNTLVDSVTELRDELEEKDKRIKRLETRLDRTMNYKE